MSISTFISYFSSLYCCKSPFNTNITRQGFPLSCQESYRTNEKRNRAIFESFTLPSVHLLLFSFLLFTHSDFYFFGLFSFTNLFCAFVHHFLVFVSNIKCLTNGRFCFRLLFFVPNSFLLCWRFCIITTKTRFYFTLTCYSFNPCRTFTIRNALLFSSCVSFIFN